MKNIILSILLIFYCSTFALAESICFGTSSKGRLENGVKLPFKGKNFTSYSKTADLIGRTYVHSKVRDIILKSYKDLEKAKPFKVFKYAETGLKKGGKFNPHKTHQNGTSVDFMVPVINSKNKSVHLPTNAFNKFGYNIEFDKLGRYKDFKIDFQAMAAHIVSLHKASLSNHIKIRRVIFDPELQPYLMKTVYGSYLKENIFFSKKRSWVRHDEHYHVDFIIKCKRL